MLNELDKPSVAVLEFGSTQDSSFEHSPPPCEYVKKECWGQSARTHSRCIIFGRILFVCGRWLRLELRHRFHGSWDRKILFEV